MQTVAMKAVDPYVNANPDTKVIRTLVAFEANVFRILNVEILKLVRTINVLILANCLVDQVLIAESITMLLFVCVPEASLAVLSRAVESLQKMRFARNVVQTLIAKLDQTIYLFVDVKKITSGILLQVVVENVKLTAIVVHRNNVLNSDVLQLVVKELVEKMPIVLPETTDLNVHAHRIS